MLSATFYSFAMGSFFLLLVYFLPIWFQAVKGASAVKSGIMNLPMVLSLIIVFILSGIGVTVTGYYAPFMIFGSIFGAIGVGLLSTLTPESNHSMWIGYQYIAGIRIGLGMQQPLIGPNRPRHISRSHWHIHCYLRADSRRRTFCLHRTERLHEQARRRSQQIRTQR